MTRGTRLLYLALLLGTLILVWTAIRRVAESQSPNGAALLWLGFSLLALTWVLARAPASLPRFVIAAARGPIGAAFAVLGKTFSARPFLYAGAILGFGAVLAARVPAMRPWPVLVLWLASMSFFVLGASGRLPRADFWSGLNARVKHARWDILICLLLALVGFALRGIAVDSIPRNIHGDEGEMGLVARSVIAGILRDPFTTAWADHATLWFFLQAGALSLFGDNLLGLRMLPAIAGALTIPAIYTYGRLLHGRGIAILAAALLLTYHFHLHFSRIGLNVVVDPLMMLSTLAALFYALRKKSPTGLAIAGILMGLSQYFYFSSRLIPVVVVAFLLALRVADRSLLPRWADIGILALGFALAIAPSIPHYMSTPLAFFGKLTDRSLLQPGYLANLGNDGQSPALALLGHAYRSVAYFIAIPERGQFYGAGIPLLDHGMEVLFVVGLIAAATRWRRPESLLLLIWIGCVALFAGVLARQEQESQRYLIGAPVFCLLMGIGLTLIHDLLVQVVGFSRVASAGVVAFCLVALMAWNTYFYFGVYTPRNSYARATAATELAFDLRDRRSDFFAYMFTPPALYLNYGTFQYIAERPPGIDVNESLTSVTALPDYPPDLRPVFIFIPSRIGELALVKERFPTGQLITRVIPGETEQILYYIYEPTQ